MILIPLVIDLFLPDPHTRYHPIALIGRWIGWWERRLNRGTHQKLRGLGLWLLVTACLMLGLQGLRLLPEPIRLSLSIGLAWLMLAGRSLVTEARRIEHSLAHEPITQTRQRLGLIVGRDTSALSEADIVRATIETIAENTIDGLIAPAGYFFLGSLWGLGLEGLVLYKAINTMDSMLGYQNERYLDFGYAAARLDDVFNFWPARLGSLLMIWSSWLLGHPLERTLRVFRRDRLSHASPNSAHPESVVAGALGIQLGGTSTYGGRMVEKPTIGEATRPIERSMIGQTNRILQLTHVGLILIGGLFVFLGGRL
ncbi:MAG TPA: cobalamin biosynthesis protein CobD [Tissierellia bacterium]|nr:cobalamin biosynthesis protein CobD [Tissierellia bacterium]